MGRKPTKKESEPWYYRYLRREISKIWGWSPARKEAKKRAQVAKNPEAYQCKVCGKQPLLKHEINVDHVICRESIHGWDSWDGYIERALGVTVDGLQILCIPCHQSKSAIENAARRAHVKNRDT